MLSVCLRFVEVSYTEIRVVVFFGSRRLDRKIVIFESYSRSSLAMADRFSVVHEGSVSVVHAKHLNKPVLIQDFVEINDVRFMRLSKTHVIVKDLLYGEGYRHGRRPFVHTSIIDQLRKRRDMVRDRIIRERFAPQVDLDHAEDTTWRLGAKKARAISAQLPRTTIIMAPSVGDAPETPIRIVLQMNPLHVHLAAETLEYLYTCVHTQIESGDMRSMGSHRSGRHPVGLKGLSRIYRQKARQSANYRFTFTDESGRRKTRSFFADDDEHARDIIHNEGFRFTVDGEHDEDSEMDEVDDE